MSDECNSRSCSTVERKRYFCGHCDDYVSKTIFYQHRRVYFEKKCKKWSKLPLLSREGSSSATVMSVYTETESFLVDTVTQQDQQLMEAEDQVIDDLQEAQEFSVESQYM